LQKLVYEGGMAQRILFVDDEAAIRDLLSLFFRRKGYEITTASSSQEARILLESNTFNLAILDLNLAGENGLELLAIFKAKHPKVPVVIFTGMADADELVQGALRAGADGFMRKTEPLEILHREVSRHLSSAA
jgi:DNA-binding NtrC family response regulator